MQCSGRGVGRHIQKCLPSFHGFLCAERRAAATMCLLSVTAHMWAAIWKYMHSRPNFLLSRCPPTRTPITATVAAVSVEEGCHGKIMRRIPWNYRGGMWTDDEPPGRDFWSWMWRPSAFATSQDKTVHLEPSLIYGTSLRMMLRGCWTATPQPSPSLLFSSRSIWQAAAEEQHKCRGAIHETRDKKLCMHLSSPALTYNNDTSNLIGGANTCWGLFFLST